ncbi:hypothetical protein [Usitatibacter palustris]|uniref:Uncharacterized protein n=1 Tax=Usitatibacter palustris TaxID=2732487 RepID=A0A6M4H530_9PROT|nr:hypothetical protein [Usitatibacter palustris]QJR14058.1 hypothetical protein DSM104440_00850 [Usitatibacter palustris]
MIACARIAGLLLVATLVSTSVEAADEGAAEKATTFSADVSGLWWNPNESGWGITITQQSQTIFALIYVYGANSQPLWLSAPAVEFVGTNASGAYIFTGALYQTSGPPFAGSFNPGNVVVTQVGTLTLTFSNYNAAQLTYTVNGASVTKNIAPYSWRINNLSGTYIGGISGQVASCTLPAVVSLNNLMTFTITQNNAAVAITVRNATGNSCALSGIITPQGKVSDINGSYSCTNGSSGQFAIRRLEAGIDGLSGVYAELSTACTASVATIGAARVIN